jgi:hypothetical protein
MSAAWAEMPGPLLFPADCGYCRRFRLLKRNA